MLSLGHEVLCVDNLLTGRRKNIQEFEKNSDFRFQLQDVTTPFQFEGPVDAIKPP